MPTAKELQALIAKKVAAVFSGEKEGETKTPKIVELKKAREEYAEAMVPDIDIKLIAEAWEEGQEVYVEGETEGEVMLAPEGEYVLDNGLTITVNDEGVITNVEGELQENGEGEGEGEEMSADKPVTQKQLTEAMEALGTTIIEALMKAEEPENKQEKKGKTEQKEQKSEKKTETKMSAQDKVEALKKAHLAKRKKIKQKQDKKPDGMAQFMESEEKDFRHKYRNPAQRRVAENLKDYELDALIGNTETN
jgi:hypothetical protein